MADRIGSPVAGIASQEGTSMEGTDCGVQQSDRIAVKEPLLRDTQVCGEESEIETAIRLSQIFKIRGLITYYFYIFYCF